MELASADRADHDVNFMIGAIWGLRCSQERYS